MQATAQTKSGRSTAPRRRAAVRPEEHRTASAKTRSKAVSKMKARTTNVSAASNAAPNVFARAMIALGLRQPPARPKTLQEHRADLARRMRARLASSYQAAGGTLPFTDWYDLQHCLPARIPGAAFVAVAGRGYIGKQVGVFGADVDENLALVAKLKRAGVAVFFDKSMPEGAAIIDKRHAVRSEDVHRTLELSRLTAAFRGFAFESYLRGMEAPTEQAARRQQDLPSKSAEEFLQRFARSKDDVDANPAMKSATHRRSVFAELLGEEPVRRETNVIPMRPGVGAI